MGSKVSRRKKVPKYPPPHPGPLYPQNPNSRYNPQDPYSRYNPQDPYSRYNPQDQYSRYNPQDQYSRYNPQDQYSRYNPQYPNSRYPRRHLRKPRYEDYDSYSDSDDDFEYRKDKGCGLRDDPFIKPMGLMPVGSFPVIDSNAWNSFNNFGYGYGCNNFEFESMGSSWSNPCDYSPVMPMGTFF
ncbi:hypothetical protein BpHYR1_006042 [Brachionus plicatilis]|uniref:Uncharacterized protein n=1 Tax=Brachionus plicatilis TaxID=10195 RepID=A0A3M7RB57_BRAPC|nr:hypothetical protein BpHYR1_006042 [Brachionus plicatilis]